jgi:hypothetical protein
MSSRITYEECIETSRAKAAATPTEEDPARTEEWVPLGPDCHCVLARRDGELWGLDFYHRRPDGLACFGWVPLAPHSPDGWTLDQLDPLTISPSVLCRGGACGDFHGWIRNGKWESA